MVKNIPIESDEDINEDQAVKANDEKKVMNEKAEAQEVADADDADAGKSGAEQETPDTDNLPDDPGELKKMLTGNKTKLEAAERQSAEYLDHLQRLKAEFENYKKRTAREKQDTIRYANEQLLGKMLGVLDNLKRGCDYAAKNAQDEEIIKGIEMVVRQLVDLLEDFGVKCFESAGKPFDPNYHEPLYAVENPDMAANTVIDEVEPGYMFHEKVLRVAKVSVSRKPAETSETTEESTE